MQFGPQIESALRSRRDVLSIPSCCCNSFYYYYVATPEATFSQGSSNPLLPPTGHSPVSRGNCKALQFHPTCINKQDINPSVISRSWDGPVDVAALLTPPHFIMFLDFREEHWYIKAVL